MGYFDLVVENNHTSIIDARNVWTREIINITPPSHSRAVAMMIQLDYTMPEHPE